MGSLQDHGTLPALSHEEWPKLPRKSPSGEVLTSLTDPASTPVFNPPAKPSKKCRRRYRSSITDIHVKPEDSKITTSRKHPCRTVSEEERVWRTGQDAMTYNAWLAKEKELDNAFRIWKETGNGKREMAEVYARFPGLRLTSMGSDDVSWFVREMSTPGTLLRKMWDDSTSSKDTESGFSVIQMKVLLVLTSPERCLGPTAMWCEWEHLFPFYRGRTDLLWRWFIQAVPSSGAMSKQMATTVFSPTTDTWKATFLVGLLDPIVQWMSYHFGIIRPSLFHRVRRV